MLAVFAAASPRTLDHRQLTGCCFYFVAGEAQPRESGRASRGAIHPVQDVRGRVEAAGRDRAGVGRRDGLLFRHCARAHIERENEGDRQVWRRGREAEGTDRVRGRVETRQEAGIEMLLLLWLTQPSPPFEPGIAVRGTPSPSSFTLLIVPLFLAHPTRLVFYASRSVDG